MGTPCFRTNVVPEYRISPDKLRALIDSSKNKCKEERAKKIEAINKIKSEIVKFIKENDMKSANTKTDILIKDENYVADLILFIASIFLSLSSLHLFLDESINVLSLSGGILYSGTTFVLRHDVPIFFYYYTIK